jgi:hypothetical protein
MLHAPEDVREIYLIPEIFLAVFPIPQPKFSHHAGLFPVIFLFPEPNFTTFIFKRNCSSGI